MASSMDELFHESYFHSSISQSSIYGATKIQCPADSKSKLLLAMLKNKIIYYETHKTRDYIAKADKEIPFTYIPTDANIVSIDSFMCGARGLIIAIAFVKDANGNVASFLNIYCNYAYDASKSDDMIEFKSVAENCRTIELHFLPFQLTHCKTKARNTDSECKNVHQTVFLLLGGDRQIHVYSQDTNQGEFSEKNLNNYFPELMSLPGVPLYLDIKTHGGRKQRTCVVGHQTGDILLVTTDLARDDWPVISSWNIQHDSPITCVRLFTEHTSEEMPEFMQANSSSTTETNEHQYHLLVTSALEDAAVYCRCTERGFDILEVLEKSSSYDCVTCCEIADIDRDGFHDILLGTYGQELVVYKFREPKKHSDENAVILEPSFLLPFWSRSFSYPIINVSVLDMTGDGLDEIAVITTRGMHMLQCNPKLALKQFQSKLIKLKSEQNNLH